VLTKLLSTEKDGYKEISITGEEVTTEQRKITTEFITEIETTTTEATISELINVIDGSKKEIPI
jgi:hypothetical protein